MIVNVYDNTSTKFTQVTGQIMNLIKTGVSNKTIDINVVTELNTIFWKIFLRKSVNSEMFEYIFRAHDKPQVFYVIDSSVGKIAINDRRYESDDNYFYAFNKETGYTVRFGKTPDDDPKMCVLGPEILDLEISVNGCPRINGKNCRFCYKNNTDKEPVNMDLNTFRQIIKKFPVNLSQIAFGITGVQTNPWFPSILRACKEEFGIIPNYTLSGADLNDFIIKQTVKYCGAVAVSCYEGAKDLCYDTIAKFHTADPNFHVNMHIVLGDSTYNHVMDVLNDIKDGKVPGLRHVVFLRIKPVGRAANMKTESYITLDMLDTIIKFCEDNNISFGFDSCSATRVIKYYQLHDRDDMVKYCEPCESSMFSSYINVNGIYHHCSFCETLPDYPGVNVLECDNFNDIWLGKDIEEYRNPKCRMSESCAYFCLDL